MKVFVGVFSNEALCRFSKLVRIWKSETGYEQAGKREARERVTQERMRSTARRMKIQTQSEAMDVPTSYSTMSAWSEFFHAGGLLYDILVLYGIRTCLLYSRRSIPVLYTYIT
jgi:hypothetical protein